MPQFSNASLNKLSTCDYRLQKLFKHVIIYYDCTVIDGYRPQNIQDIYYNTGKSKVKWPDSKHNKQPSLAIDVAPYIQGKGIIWEPKQCYTFGGFVLGCALSLDIDIIWGGDWDSDKDISDQTFNDLVHFQVK